MEYLKRFERLSFGNKTKSWYEDIAKELINGSESAEYKMWREKCLINYGLYNARGIENTIHKNKVSKYRLSHEEFKHNDIISYIARSMVGDQMDRPFKYSVIDTSNYSANERTRQRLKLIGSLFNERYVRPLEQQESIKYQLENGIKDVFSLTPEERQQMSQDIQNRVQQVLPDDVKKVLSNKIYSPIEKQGGALLRVLEQDQSLKFKTDLGFENGIITNLEAYRLSILHHKPIVDTVNPKGFRYFMSPNKFFFNEADWVVYEEDMAYMDVLERFGGELTAAMLKKIEEQELYVGSTKDEHSKARILSVVVENEGFFEEALKDVDFRTKEGQRVLGNLYDMYGRTLDSLVVPVTHVNFKAPRKFYKVIGSNYEFWADESYVKRSGEKVQIFWGVEAYEIYMIGGINNEVFVKAQPLPYQYMSPENPFYTTLSYYGAEYSRLSGNAEPVSSIDLGKPGQYRFNRQVKLIEKTLAKDHGKGVMLAFTAKPDHYSEEQWISMFKDEGFLVVDPSKITQADAQYLFKELNLSQDDKLANQLSYLAQIKEDTASAMYYNSARLGISEERTAVRNNMQNLQQSVSQTRPIYYLHDQIVQSMLNGLINYGRIAVKQDKKVMSYMLDDFTVADVEIDGEMLWTSQLGVHVVGMGDSTESLYMFKSQALGLLQNKLISSKNYARVMNAKSFAEIIEIMEDEQEMQQRAMEGATRMSQEEQEKARNFEKELIALKAQMEMLITRETNMSKENMALMNSMLMANAQDIDKSGVSDTVENSNKQRQFDAVQAEKDRNLKREEMDNKLKIAAMKPKQAAKK